MDPFGHHHHRHHHNRPEEDPNPNPYPDPNPFPPPGTDPYGYQPPPPPPGPFYGGGPPEFGRPAYPPPPNVGYGRPDYAPPPPVQHVSHEVGSGAGGYGFDDQGPHYPDQSHAPPSFSPPQAGYVSPADKLGDLLQRPTVRIYTKAREDFSLSIREGKVVLVPANPSDPYQHWIKDSRYSTRVKDAKGMPSFALVNKVTGEAIKHSIGANHPVRLVPYNPDYLDESVLWAESHDIGGGFRCIRMVNNILLNFDAFHGDKKHGGVKDGTYIVLGDWVEGENQMWKIVPYSG